MSISSSAMLVELNISVWTATVVDRKATTKVTDEAHAASDAGLFKKNLTAGTSLRKSISDYAALCRTWHNGRTLPWADRGPRLLPTSMFFDYKQELNHKRDYFNNLRSRFVTEYPQLLAEAPLRLGDLFNPLDFPTVEEVESKFAFNVVFSPVPEAGDFRIDVGNSELVELRAQYDSAYEDRVADAMKTTWDKLHGVLTGVSEKLTEPEGDKAKIFHSTFLTNITDLCGLLTHLNITKDPKLEEARMQLERAVNAVTLDDVKEDPLTRADVKAKVDGILSSFDW